MALIRLAFWGSLFVLSTFAFTVLFEHGPMGYFANAKKEKETLMVMFGKKVERRPAATSSSRPELGSGRLWGKARGSGGYFASCHYEALSKRKWEC